MAKILVIEDKEPIRNNIQDALEFEAFEAIVAENGRIGVEMALKHLPDLIICDVMMPELDGYGVLTKLRNDEATSNIPLIFLTAKADRASLRQGMELGADDYITKPFTPDELLKAIQARLDKRVLADRHYASQIRQAEETFEEHLSYTDGLTHLSNQLYLQKRFTQIQHQAANTNQKTAVLIISLEQFRRIHDTLGHGFGKLLLRAVAKRLTEQTHNLQATIDTIAPLEIAKLAVLFKPTSDQQDILVVAQTLVYALSQPFIINNHKISLTANIGVAVCCPGVSQFCIPSANEQEADATHRSSERTAKNDQSAKLGCTHCPQLTHDLDDLLDHAEAAVRQAIQDGGNCFRLYTTDLQISTRYRSMLEADLYNVIEQNQLQVYYQPQVDLKTGQIIGAEALIRWQHPELGFISPSEFIPIAEEIGLIVPIGEWVLKVACAQAKSWQNQHGQRLKIAVNLSALQFHQPNLIEMIIQTLNQTALDPDLLELELTESILMQNLETSIAMFNHLKALGVHISIDDFGVGYSSLGYLQKIPFDTLKVDQCFIRNITHNSTNIAIAQAIFQMARGLGLKTTAEGVETESELAFLCEHHCDVIQGYFFSPPVPSSQFDELLITRKELSRPQTCLQSH